jgi:hypothetical protein
MRHLQYAFHSEDGSIISRCGDELAWPILDYEAIGKDGNYNAPLKYDLEKVGVHSVGREWEELIFTKFVPTEFKNIHRKFWGMKELPVEPLPKTIRDLCVRHKTRFYYKGENLVGIFHGTWGSPKGLYHWFTKTRKGYRLFSVSREFDDDHKDAKKVEIKSLKRGSYEGLICGKDLL